ncbi:uridine kinase family protein [Cellulomonas cellasea]|nr:hypothetical protein [Cellulomonas cellasea]GEA86753.1 hypothetical protein CCE01nite_07020 [Cellulomonas cellasea]
MITLPPGEPAAGPWRAVPEAELAASVLHAAGAPTGRPRVVAVDGRSASGKSTLAERLSRQVGRAKVVHTDDLAWHESFFGWGDLLVEHVLRPLHRGEAVSFRPPAWDRHGREGAVDVPAGLELVVVEGVGASRRAWDDLVDATLWVQSDAAVAEERGLARDLAQGVNGDAAATVAFWHEWMAEELRFLAHERPWERARLVVAGTPVVPLRDGEVAVAPGPA